MAIRPCLDEILAEPTIFHDILNFLAIFIKKCLFKIDLYLVIFEVCPFCNSCHPNLSFKFFLDSWKHWCQGKDILFDNYKFGKVIGIDNFSLQNAAFNENSAYKYISKLLFFILVIAI